MSGSDLLRFVARLLVFLQMGGGQATMAGCRVFFPIDAVWAQGAPLEETGPSGEYEGQPVSMEFQNAELRSVLRTFAAISGLNLVIDPQVAGTVDVALVDVPWDQAFAVILRANRLGYEVDGTIVRIAPLATLAAEDEDRRAHAEQRALAGELVVLTRALGYARAAELAELVTRTVLSPRGQVQIDGRTNTLIVADLQERVDAVQALIDELDRPEPQVQIQARIVQASQDYLRELGVQWGVAGRVAPEIGNTAALAFPNRGGISGRVGGAQGPAAAGADPRAAETESSGTAVDLGAASPTAALGVALGAIDGSLNLDVVLSAAESDGHVRILSNPRITTQNNVEAVITQGDQIPIQTVANNTVTVTFRDAALRLAVTPQITTADTVIMRIEIGNDYADFAREVNGVPPIVTQSASTTVQVADGATTVIAGIYESARTRANRRVPGIHRVPILGWFFRSRAERRRTDELLIFLTPRIVR
jgi:type IV pilus assembly protein PilQ